MTYNFIKNIEQLIPIDNVQNSKSQKREVITDGKNKELVLVCN